MRERFENNDPIVGLLGEPSGKFDYCVIYGESKLTPIAEVSSCKPPPPDPESSHPKPHIIPPYYQKAIKALSKTKKPPTVTSVIPEPIPCCMFEPSSPKYSSRFPKPEEFDNLNQRAKHVYKVKNPTTTVPQGEMNQVTATEETLNWQAENAVAQNHVISKIA